MNAKAKVKLTLVMSAAEYAELLDLLTNVSNGAPTNYAAQQRLRNAIQELREAPR